jgi:drug/metabolite transporter (DMT)-like permease
MKPSAKENKERYLALLLMTLTVVFWGLSIISTKVVLAQVPPITIALIRYVIATATLIPLALYTHSLSKMESKDIMTIAVTSLLGIVLYFVFENTALQYTTASNASMIVAALPIFALIIEATFFRLKVDRWLACCLIVSIVGVYLVVTVNGRLDFSSARFLGNLLMIGSMICWVIYTFLNRNLDQKYPSIAIITYQSLASIFLFVPFVLPEMGRWPNLTSLSPAIWMNLIFLGVFCSALEYLFYIYAVKRLGATVSSTFLNLIPVVTVVAGFLLLQEKLFWIEILGMGLIMASIYGLNRRTSESEAVPDVVPGSEDRMPQLLATIIHNGKRTTHVYLQSVLAVLRQ